MPIPLHLRLLLPLLVLGLGVASGHVQPVGLCLGALYSAWLLGGESHLPRGLWWSLSLLGSIALAAHLLPGFVAMPLWAARQLSPDAAPYVLRLSWDKWLVGMTLLAWWLGQSARAHAHSRRAWAIALLTLLAVPTLALGLDLLAWQPKWPTDLGLWLAVNIGVAVLTEELLFRAWLQPWLIARLGIWPGLLLTAGLFAAVHLPFSPLFALVAGVAGLGYGLVFYCSGRLLAAVALHAAVNLLHVLLLSYPLRLT
jgi:membrane protease YdiL (CAAX protease family)